MIYVVEGTDSIYIIDFYTNNEEMSITYRSFYIGYESQRCS